MNDRLEADPTVGLGGYREGRRGGMSSPSSSSIPAATTRSGETSRRPNAWPRCGTPRRPRTTCSGAERPSGARSAGRRGNDEPPTCMRRARTSRTALFIGLTARSDEVGWTRESDSQPTALRGALSDLCAQDRCRELPRRVGPRRFRRLDLGPKPLVIDVLQPRLNHDRGYISITASTGTPICVAMGV